MFHWSVLLLTLISYRNEGDNWSHEKRQNVKCIVIYYEKIIRVCKDKGIKTTVKHSKDSNSTGSEVDAYRYTRTTRALAQLDSNISLHEFLKNENRQYDQKQCKEVRMLYAYEKIADNLLQICSADQQSLAEEQIKQKRLLDKIASGEIDINQHILSEGFGF